MGKGWRINKKHIKHTQRRMCAIQRKNQVCNYHVEEHRILDKKEGGDEEKQSHTNPRLGKMVVFFLVKIRNWLFKK